MADMIPTHTMRIALEAANERHRQIIVEGWPIEHDDAHDRGDLARAAATYAMCAAGDVQDRAVMDVAGYAGVEPSIRNLWPRDWDIAWLKPRDRRHDLIRALGLIIAEVERLDRADGRGLAPDLDILPRALAEIAAGCAEAQQALKERSEDFSRLEANAGDATQRFRLDLLQLAILYAHDLEALEPVGRGVTLRMAAAELTGTAAFLIHSVKHRDGEAFSPGRFAFVAWLNAAQQAQQIAALVESRAHHQTTEAAR